MQDNPHILLLSPQPFFQARGTPINVREMLYALSEAGIKITLLCYPFGEDISIKNVSLVRSPKVYFIRHVKIGPSFSKIFLDFFFLIKATQLIYNNKFSVFHGIEEAGLIAGLLGMISKKPFIVDVDSAMSQQLEESGFIKSRWILRRFENIEAFFFKRAARVITVCKALSEEVNKIAPGSKITQIEDFPLDYSETIHDQINLREQYKIEEDRKIIIYGGNFEPYQGIDLLINALALALKNDFFRAHLVLIGGSRAHIAHYQDLAKTAGLNEHISFTGQTDSNLMGSLHNQADILVSPRLKGTNTPLKIYSYMQTGKPIVATNIYSHTQVLNSDCAFLSDPTPEAFSLALIEAASNETLKINEKNRRSNNAKHLTQTKYSRKHFRESLVKVYQEILWPQ